MTLNDLECPIQLKVRFTDGTLDVRMLWLSELTMRDWMNMAFTVSDKNEANELWFQRNEVCTNLRRGYCRGAKNRSWAAKLGHYSHYASSFLRYLWDVWPFGICIIIKAVNGFLVIQKQMTLKVYNSWKLHRPRMSHSLLADNVDAILDSLVQGMRCSVKCTISERAENDVRSWRTVSLR